MLDNIVMEDGNSSILFRNKNSSDNLKDIIEKILIIFFDGERAKVSEFDNRLSFACPFCGDSKKDYKLKRANIYLETRTFHCFNCGTHRTIEEFLNDFNESSDNIEYKIIKNKYKKNNSALDLDLIFNHKIDDYLIDKKEVDKAFKFKKISEFNLKSYLNSRLYFDFENFSYDPSNRALVIYNLNKDNKAFGFQIRLFKKHGPKYLSYKLSKIYEQLNLESNETIEKFDHLSLFFNILNIDYSNIVTIFEGPLDSFQFYNSISLSGVVKNLPFNFDRQRYFLDNDEPGMKKSYGLLEKGELIFLWKKFLDDFKIKKKIKDLNELMIYLKSNKIRNYNFDKYFSTKKLDLIYV